MKYTPALARLIESLRCLPGVGPKSAQRMAFHLLERDRDGGRALTQALTEALARVGHCTRCRMLSEEELCAICASAQRVTAQLCVVESPADVVAIEQSGGFRGRYFVLMGHLSPLDGIGTGRTRPRRVRAPARSRRGRGGHPRDESDRGRRGDRALSRRARGAPWASRRRASRTACRSAASWNTSTAERSPTRSPDARRLLEHRAPCACQRRAPNAS